MARAIGFAGTLVLKAIREGFCYGLDIIDETGLSGGTVYKVLARFERRGFVSSRWEDHEIAEAEKRPRRRYYRVTPEGEEALSASLHRVRRLLDESVGEEARS